MSHLLFGVENGLRVFAESVPLEVFVFAGSLLEEIVSPIPSLAVMSIAGSMAFAGGYPVAAIFTLSFIANTGKILGAFGYYVLGDKLEDVVVKKFGGYFGITHEQVEHIGARFNGGWRDGLPLFFLRLLPMMPTTPVSIVCGVIKMDRRVFLSATFLGNFLKDSGYLFFGYFGLSFARELFERAIAWKYHMNVLFAIGTAIFLFFLWYHRKKGVWLWQKCRDVIKL